MQTPVSVPQLLPEVGRPRRYNFKHSPEAAPYAAPHRQGRLWAPSKCLLAKQAAAFEITEHSLSLTFCSLLLAYLTQNPLHPHSVSSPTPPPALHALHCSGFLQGPGKGLSLQKQWPFTLGLDGSLAFPHPRRVEKGGCTTKGEEGRPPLQAWLQAPPRSVYFSLGAGTLCTQGLAVSQGIRKVLKVDGLPFFARFPQMSKFASLGRGHAGSSPA